MIKNVLGILVIAALMISCGTTSDEKKTDAAPVSVEFASLIENPAEYLDKDITIEGSVVHVCKHTGKKMFIVGENPDIRLFISAGDEVPVFPMELMGSTVSVTGHLAMVEAGEEKHDGTGEGEHAEEGEHSDEAEHAEEAKEQKVEAEEEAVVAEEAAEGEECETEAALAEQPVLAQYVLHYKTHVEK